MQPTVHQISARDEVARALFERSLPQVMHHLWACMRSRCSEPPLFPHRIMQLTDFALVSNLGTADAHQVFATCPEYLDDRVMYKIGRREVVL